VVQSREYLSTRGPKKYAERIATFLPDGRVALRDVWRDYVDRLAVDAEDDEAESDESDGDS
jgi:hypothetical protein